MEEERFPDLEQTITVIKVATGNLMQRAYFLDNGYATKRPFKRNYVPFNFFVRD